jgi:hypothetical protein
LLAKVEFASVKMENKLRRGSMSIEAQGAIQMVSEHTTPAQMCNSHVHDGRLQWRNPASIYKIMNLIMSRVGWVVCSETI